MHGWDQRTVTPVWEPATAAVAAPRLTSSFFTSAAEGGRMCACVREKHTWRRVRPITPPPPPSDLKAPIKRRLFLRPPSTPHPEGREGSESAAP